MLEKDLYRLSRRQRAHLYVVRVTTYHEKAGSSDTEESRSFGTQAGCQQDTLSHPPLGKVP